MVLVGLVGPVDTGQAQQPFLRRRIPLSSEVVAVAVGRVSRDKPALILRLALVRRQPEVVAAAAMAMPPEPAALAVEVLVLQLAAPGTHRQETTAAPVRADLTAAVVVVAAPEQ